jgi:MoxR-like ATPase
VSTPFSKFEATRRELNAAIIERDQEIDLSLTALVAREHVLLVGPPGTGKSLICNSLAAWMHGNCFSVLLSKFSTPEDVFGPISVQGLKLDQYYRITQGKMADASFCFVDEVFNASSAILNTMLQVLNERTFRNGNTILNCPLQICVGASNQWPGSQEGSGVELGALFDRFLFRKSVRPIAMEKSLNRLLWDSNLTPKLSTTITPAEIDAASAEAGALPWKPEAQEAFQAIHREAKREGIVPGDRRLRKAVKAARAFAWLQGAAEVEPEHLEILSHVLWDDPAEQPKKVAEIVGKIANPSAMQVNGLLSECEQIIADADRKDTGKCVAAIKKLHNVANELKKLSGAKAAQAKAYIDEQLKEMKLAFLD